MNSPLDATPAGPTTASAVRSAGRAGVLATIVGGLVGLIFPPSLIVGAAVGGASGGVWGKIRDKGFKDEDLKAVGDSLEPGTSAIIAIAEDRTIERLMRGLEGYQKVARHALSAEAAAVIVAEADDTA